MASQLFGEGKVFIGVVHLPLRWGTGALEHGGANGIIVGTNLKHGGMAANRIDPERVKRLAQVIRAMG